MDRYPVRLKLYSAIEKTLIEQVPLDCFQTHHKEHGRHTQWHCKVFDANIEKAMQIIRN